MWYKFLGFFDMYFSSLNITECEIKEMHVTLFVISSEVASQQEDLRIPEVRWKASNKVSSAKEK